MKYIFLALLLSSNLIASTQRSAEKKNEANVKTNLACGETGTVEARILDCSISPGSVKGNFLLVTRTAKFKEIYKDIKSGLIWGDRLPNIMSYFDAQKVCQDTLPEVGGLKLVWRLPTKQEFEVAGKNQIHSSLSNFNHYFWTSTLREDSASYGWLFNGFDGNTDYFSLYTDVSVRCVSI